MELTPSASLLMSTGSGLTVAVDGAYGATSNYVWAGGSFGSASSTLGQVNLDPVVVGVPSSGALEQQLQLVLV